MARLIRGHDWSTSLGPIRGLAGQPQDHARPDAELPGAPGAAVGTGRHHALQRRLWRLRRRSASRDPGPARARRLARSGRPQQPCHGGRHGGRHAGVQGPRAGPQSPRHARARLDGSLLLAGDRRGRQAGRRDRRRGRDHRARAGPARDRGAGRASGADVPGCALLHGPARRTAARLHRHQRRLPAADRPPRRHRQADPPGAARARGPGLLRAARPRLRHGRAPCRLRVAGHAAAPAGCRPPDAALEERLLDFIYQPVRDAAGRRGRHLRRRHRRHRARARHGRGARERAAARLPRPPRPRHRQPPRRRRDPEDEHAAYRRASRRLDLRLCRHGRRPGRLHHPRRLVRAGLGQHRRPLQPRRLRREGGDRAVGRPAADRRRQPPRARASRKPPPSRRSGSAPRSACRWSSKAG